MMESSSAPVEIRDLSEGLWIWRLRHPHWKPGVDWEPLVSCTCVQSRGATLLLDPLAPPAQSADVWHRLDAASPTGVVILKPDHVRDVDRFVQRYGIPGFGPRLFFREDIPQTHLEPIDPGTELPGGLVALYDGRGRNETPLWLPDHRTLVFADALTSQGGELRIWNTPWHRERTLPALRSLLDLPFERVIVSHGEPVHSRSAYERSLLLEPFQG